MSPQRTAELEYWRGEFARYATPEEYVEARTVRDLQADGWIGVDLDGTLAKYLMPEHSERIGPPITEMVERVKRWREAGIEVRIFTARVVSGKAEIAKVEEWCLRHLGEVLDVTNVKDYQMLELWDDRCVQVIPNSGVVVGKSQWGFE